jgi:hypothetical protein
VEFFSADYKRLGDKLSLERIIHERTGIPVEALQVYDPTKFSVDEYIFWVAERETKHEEDMAYSLLGVFGIFLALIYGKGRDNALRRLLEEANKSPDITAASVFSVPFRRDPDFIDRSSDNPEDEDYNCDSIDEEDEDIRPAKRQSHSVTKVLRTA